MSIHPVPTTNKIKCYLNRGSPQQRIRKVSLASVDSLEELRHVIRKEFEWAETVQLSISYEDAEGDVIEVSSSTSISDVVEEAKCLVIQLENNI